MADCEHKETFEYWTAGSWPKVAPSGGHPPTRTHTTPFIEQVDAVIWIITIIECDEIFEVLTLQLKIETHLLFQLADKDVGTWLVPMIYILIKRITKRIDPLASRAAPH
jgi:hypothetical protein